jgi:predicted ferric reductase
MELEKTSLIDLETAAPVMTIQSLMLLFLSVVMGAFLALAVLPGWLPGLATSLTGDAPKAYWYLSRGSALVAFAFLWLSMGLGLIISNKLARLWPGGPAAFDIHQYTSLLGLAFAVFHALILMGDVYIAYTLSQVLMPFASENYKPIWVGLGQIGIYAWAIVVLSFYVRSRMGTRMWRLLHFISFFVFAFAMFHGIYSGTDSADPWIARMYLYSAASLLFLLLYRVLSNPKLPFVKLWSRPPASQPDSRKIGGGVSDLRATASIGLLPHPAKVETDAQSLKPSSSLE